MYNILWVFVPLCQYCMNEMRCHVVLHAWLIGKEPRRAEYPVQMVGFDQAVSLVRWLLMLGGPFICNWKALSFFNLKSKLEERIYRWKWTEFEGMSVCTPSLETSYLQITWVQFHRVLTVWQYYSFPTNRCLCSPTPAIE